MKFKHRIWFLPIMTAVIVTVGIAINSRINAKTLSALSRVENVQYPSVEALRTMRGEVTDIQKALQRTVAEGDQEGIATTEPHANEVREALRALAKADPDSSLPDALTSAFDAYYVSATFATRIMLGTETGDGVEPIANMQKTSEALHTLLTRSQEAAIDEFRSLLASGSDSMKHSMIVSLVMAGVMLIVLGAGSYVLIGSVFRDLGGEPEVAVATVRSIASGDFTTAVNLQLGDQTSLLHGIETLRQKLGTLIRDVRKTSGAVDTAANDINEGIERLSLRTSDQAASLEETASSMEEMTVTVKRNADNARHANELASEARDQAQQGGVVATRAIEAMAEINNASRRIADIIGVIDGIAFQTNLLALNAAVEAARAGEQGRGFAVVASEVRNLAQRSTTAAHEIKGLIHDSVMKVQDGSKLVDESGRHLSDIVASAKKVADIIGEISSASQQQANGLDQVNGAITQMDESTQQNAAMAEETAAVAGSMAAQARELRQLISVFRVEDHGAAEVASSNSHAYASYAPSEGEYATADDEPAQRVANF